MQTRTYTIAVLAPALVAAWLMYSYHRHRTLVARFECPDFPCVRDVNGDGRLDSILTTRPPTLHQASWGDVIIVVDGRRRPLVPHNPIDNTWRTHVAVVPHTEGASHLVVFDGTAERGLEPIKGAFAWDQSSVVPVKASWRDRRVMAAMAAFDDKGMSWFWILARFVLPVLLLGYYFVLTLLALLDWSRGKLRGARSARRREAEA